MEYWYKFHKEKAGKFDIIASWTYETIPIRDMFDDTCYNIEEMEEKVNNGDSYWFVLRVESFLNGVKLAEEFLGANFYDEVEAVLTDGCYDDLKETVIEKALEWLDDAFEEMQEEFGDREEEDRRDEKNGLYPEHEDIAN
jgi:hypothetical protein